MYIIDIYLEQVQTKVYRKCKDLKKRIRATENKIKTLKLLFNQTCGGIDRSSHEYKNCKSNYFLKIDKIKDTLDNLLSINNRFCK